MDVPTFRSTAATRVPLLGVDLDRAVVAVPATPVALEDAQFRSSRLGLIASIVLGVDLSLLGLSFLFSAVLGLAAMFDPGGEAGGLPGVYDDPGLLWVNAFVVLVMMGFVPLGWVFVTRHRARSGTLRYLGLHRPARSLFVGTGLAGLFLSGSIALLLFFAVTGLPISPREIEEHPIPPGFTWALVAMVSFAAGFGEEILFRGLLQRWIGWLGQAALFAVAHLGSGEPVQFVVTFATGLIFGRLRALGWSLWTLITAHAVYDFCLLGLELATSP
ncbi:MAG: CPBP family intramembrane metalloprotease [Euryarchaeota archaeon]|nr:CPBP family intramembrane metalloprotease [Euryarchaeota archaeon]